MSNLLTKYSNFKRHIMESPSPASELWRLLLTRSGICMFLPGTRKALWQHQISSEIAFWDECVRTLGQSAGSSLMENYLNPELRLQDNIAELLLENEETHLLLDVGAGPFTFLGKKHERFRFKIVAVDPLADAYDQILVKYSIMPLVRTEKLEAELLTTRFKENTFDLASARNCLDHSYSPETAIVQMIKVVKPGRYVLLKHVPNEAERERYGGLHQWNFCEKSGDFIIGSKWTSVNMTRKYKTICSIECSYETSDSLTWLVARIRKK